MKSKSIATLLVAVAVTCVPFACAQKNEVSGVIGRTFIDSQTITGATFTNPQVNFGDGTTAPVHRDLYSAFLARHCGCENLDVPGVIDTWPRAEQLVRRAMLLLDAKGRPIRQTASDKTGNAGASSRAKPESQVGFILPQAFRRLRAGSFV